MDERQKIADFLQNIAVNIPRLFQLISEGNVSSHFILGTQQINGQQVRLIMKAEVVEEGTSVDLAPGAPEELIVRNESEIR